MTDPLHRHNPSSSPQHPTMLQQPQQLPESSETLTLEPSHPQNSPSPQPQTEQTPIECDPTDDDAEIPAPFSPPDTDPQASASATVSCRGGGPKRKKIALKRRAQEKKSQKKLEILAETFKPIPFVPVDLDFSSHEDLLKQLGLWDFVHLDFDRTLRSDLIAQLIATYGSRCGYVNGARINVSRAALADALKLPKKKDKDSAVDQEECKKLVAFMEEFVSKWLLLHGDMWIMPAEVLNWMKLIKDGNLDKVDWVTLLWFMVEKEITDPHLGDCYYASHLQCLIKSQKEELLLEELQREVDVKEVDVKDDEEEEDGSRDVKMADDANESHGALDLEEHNIELSLGGQENVTKDSLEKKVPEDGDDVMDFEESKGSQHELCPLGGKSKVSSESFLRPCSVGDIGSLDCEEDKKEEGEEVGKGEEEDEKKEEEEHEGGFPFSLKCETMDGLTSTNLLEAMEGTELPFGAGLQLRDNPSGEFHASRLDSQTVPGGSSFLGNCNKREIEHENDISRHSFNGSNKRLRSDVPCMEKSSDFDMCMDQVQHWIGKARMLYTAKEQSYSDFNTNQKLLLDELGRRNSMIEHLHKAKIEEQNRRQLEVYRLEHELYMMEKLLDGYKRALKETQRSFAEYRARCPQLDEPVYGDVSGSGGLVLSRMEIEKQRLKEEEEDRMKRSFIEKKFIDFEVAWMDKLEGHTDAVCLLGSRLTDAEKEVKLLKELFANRKTSDTLESVPHES